MAPACHARHVAVELFRFLRFFKVGNKHDDIAPSERGHQDLLDVGAERDVVDRAIEDGRRGQLRRPERSNHGVRFPVAAGGVIGDARPARASRIAA